MKKFFWAIILLALLGLGALKTRYMSIVDDVGAMYPTLEGRKRVLIDKFNDNISGLSYDDFVLYKLEKVDDLYLARVIGKPGDTISI